MKLSNYNTRRILPLLAFATMAFATSCSNDSLADVDPDNGEGQAMVLTARLNDNKNTTTRVGMTKDDATTASFYWHSGDGIYVQTVKNKTQKGAQFTTSDTETGDNFATFTGTVSSGFTLGSYAVYPYNKNHQFTSATVLKYYLPATYTYDKVESKIFSNIDAETYPENSTNIPLVGKIDDGYIEFKHIGGLAVIRVDKMPVDAGTLTITANEQLSGKFTIADLTVTDPVITTATASSNNSVTFTFSNATEGAAGVFYLPVATGSYSGVAITITSTDNSVSSTANYGTFSVDRGSIVALPLYNNDGTIDKYVRDSEGNYIFNGHKFVDLGLDSGLLWAVTNIGAESETDFGDYFTWGGTVANSATNKYGSFQSWTKYNFTDGLTVLEPSDDAAYVNWGTSCRMATYDEWSELISSCTWTYTTENEVVGFKVTGTKTGYTDKSIFLPRAGILGGYESPMAIIGQVL